MRFKNICIIGLGNIGYFHFLGVLKISKLNFNLILIDNNKKRFENIKKNKIDILNNKNLHNMSYYSDYNKIKTQKIDLLIISTSSSERYQITKNMISKYKILNILFEKVLFNKIYQYQNINLLLYKKKIKAWVNCNYQAQNYFINLKKKIKKTDNLNMKVIGGKWNIGTSAIHFIDLFCFLSNSEINRLILRPINNKIYKSKRSKYYEFNAQIIAFNKKNQTLLIENNRSNLKPLIINLFLNNHLISINNNSKLIHDYKINSNKININIDKFFTKLQSFSTGEIAEEILLKNRSSLPTFNSSFLNHVHLLKAINKEFKNTKLVCKNEIFIT